MKRFLLSIFTLFILSLGCAQVDVSQQVVGSTNILYTGESVSLSSTAGEAITRTISSNSYILTQGFEQPLYSSETISFDIAIGTATCPTSFDASAAVSNIQGCEGRYQIIWSSGDTGAVAMNLSPGLYTVTVSAGQCEQALEFEVFSGPAALCELKFFNAFSPNDDGINDTWIIQNVDAPEFAENKVEIFNRWGQSIWTGEFYNNSDVVWSGKTENGTTLSQGTYYYIADIAGIIYKGYIELTK